MSDAPSVSPPPQVWAGLWVAASMSRLKVESVGICSEKGQDRPRMGLDVGLERSD